MNVKKDFDMFAEQVYRDRRSALRKKIKSGIIVFLGNDYAPMNYPSNTYPFRQDSNFAYYFGLDLPNLVGVIDLEGGRDTIYANDYTMDDIIWMGPQTSIAEQAEAVGVPTVRPRKEVAREVSSALCAGRKVHFLPTYRGDQTLELCEWLGITPAALRLYVSKELVSAVIEQRSVKAPEEIAELDAANGIGYRMHITAMRMAEAGKKEQEIAGILDGIARSYGRITSFSTILSMNGQTLHNEKHDGILQEGRLMLVDCGAETMSYYASDNTRVTPIGGKFTRKQQDIYEIVLRCLETGIALAGPEVKYIDVHKAVCKVLTEGLQDVGVMQGDVDESVMNGAHALFLPHGLGHMIGMDAHDMEGLGEDNVGYDSEVQRQDQFGTASLRFGRRLKEGFCVSVEPGIYFIPELIAKWKREKINANFINFEKLEEFLDFGGIRLEDCIVIGEKGCRILGADAQGNGRIPVSVREVEAMAQQRL